MVGVLTWVSLVILVSGLLCWATAARVAPRQGWRYYQSASRQLFAISGLTAMAAIILALAP